jgi:hypothetical protein
MTEMLAAAIASGLVVLVSTACALLADDWRVETQSRYHWAAVALHGGAQSSADIHPDIEERCRAILDSRPFNHRSLASGLR